MAAMASAAVNLADAAVSIVVTGWFNSLSVTGIAVTGAATFTRGAVGTKAHTFTLPVDIPSLRITLDGLNSGGNDLDLYLYRDIPGPPTLIASATTSNPDETLVLGALPAGTYTAWVYSFNAVPVTGTPYTLSLTGCNVTGTPVTGWGTPVRVMRVVTDITGVQAETEILGSPVVPSNGQLVAWDTVAPLGVPVFYRIRDTLTLPDTQVVTLTSNTVTITGQGDGWLKDPVQPVNDVHLSGLCPGCANDVDCPNAGGVTYQTLGDETFKSANGRFEPVDTARPRVITQTRHAAEGTLTLMSHHLPDAFNVEKVVRSGRILCLQLDPSYGWAYDRSNTDFIDVGDVKRGRISTTNMRYTPRVWTLPIALTNAPFVSSDHAAGNNVGVTGAVLATGIASGRTLATRTALGQTLRDSALGRGH